VVYVNGALATPTVNAADPKNPIFTIPAAIQGGKQLTVAFQAKVAADTEPDLYCNAAGSWLCQQVKQQRFSLRELDQVLQGRRG